MKQAFKYEVIVRVNSRIVDRVLCESANSAREVMLDIVSRGFDVYNHGIDIYSGRKRRTVSIMMKRLGG